MTKKDIKVGDKLIIKEYENENIFPYEFWGKECEVICSQTPSEEDSSFTFDFGSYGYDGWIIYPNQFEIVDLYPYQFEIAKDKSLGRDPVKEVMKDKGIKEIVNETKEEIKKDELVQPEIRICEHAYDQLKEEHEALQKRFEKELKDSAKKLTIARQALETTILQRDEYKQVANKSMEQLREAMKKVREIKNQNIIEYLGTDNFELKIFPSLVYKKVNKENTGGEGIICKDK